MSTAAESVTAPAAPIPFDREGPVLGEAFHTAVAPTPVADPGLVRVNDTLARELGIDPAALRSPEGVAILAGNRVPEGAEPRALAYAGHQFGNWVPQLGDGRAILLGEVVDRQGVRRDLQLKGAGPTPFSRGGDGRAPIGPVVREYLGSEFMAALGVPTTRALAAVTTGEPVRRGWAVHPGGVITRVAASHVRVGTFEYFGRRGDVEGVRTLADYVIQRHYPEVAGAEEPYPALFSAVIARTADLIAHWMAAGFIHGVMNTDNLALAGETLDYGPFGFLDTYAADTCYSSIDTGGRYAFDQQPAMARWGLTRLAECLLPLLGEESEARVERAKALLDEFLPRFEATWRALMAERLGLAEVREGDGELLHDLLQAMADGRADYHLTLRGLSDLPDIAGPADAAVVDLFDEPAAITAWLARWRARLAEQGRDEAERQTAMRAVNPKFVLRNHLAQWAVDAATEEGDFTPMDRLLAVLTDPFADHPGEEELARPPRDEQRVQRTFCGT
ncbi:MAG: protein adenylyltransferase SelO [Thiohalospira sp.]